MAALPDVNELLVETIARHFEGAAITNSNVAVGFGGVSIGCRVGDAKQMAEDVFSVPLYLTLAGDELYGPTEMFMTAFGETAHTAVIRSACAWACSYGPVLRAALSDDVVDGVEQLRISAGDAELRGYTSTCDVMLALVPEGCEQPSEARGRFGGQPYLLPQVIEHVPLVTDRVQLLTMFVGEWPGNRVVEVKIDGRGADLTELFGSVPKPGADQMTFLREMAILVPD